VPAFAAILRLPFAILIPLIIYVCAIGAYAVNNSTTDIWYMMFFGIAGYLFKKLDYPIAPLVLALVLGDTAESALRQSLIMSQGSPLIFFSSPIAAALVVLSSWLLVSPVIHPLIHRAWDRRGS
jgi:putative tricarboxylic transport membrane protein